VKVNRPPAVATASAYYYSYIMEDSWEVLEDIAAELSHLDEGERSVLHPSGDMPGWKVTVTVEKL